MEAVSERPASYWLALEIHHVASTVQAVVHGLKLRSFESKHDWLRIQIGTRGKKGTKTPNHTVRDYVIYRYAKKNFPEQRDADIDSREVARSDTKKLMALCPLGFDFISNARILQIDHFYPENLFIQHIIDIEGNGDLRRDIRQTLLSIDRGQGDTLTSDFIEMLIPQSGPMIALKFIYYNYSANLWPLSGPMNARKGARNPFAFAMACVQSEFDEMGASLSRSVIEETEAFLMDFESVPREGRCIIPHMLCSDGSLRTGLECFLQTTVGKAARKMCADISKIGQMGMESAYALAVQLQHPDTHSAAKGMRRALKIIHQVRKAILPHPPQSIPSSSDHDSSSLDSEGAKVLKISREHLTKAIDNEGRKGLQRKMKRQLREEMSDRPELSHDKSAISVDLNEENTVKVDDVSGKKL